MAVGVEVDWAMAHAVEASSVSPSAMRRIFEFKLPWRYIVTTLLC